MSDSPSVSTERWCHYQVDWVHTEYPMYVHYERGITYDVRMYVHTCVHMYVHMYTCMYVRTYVGVLSLLM